MQGTDARRWRPGNRTALIVSIGLALMAAAPASAQVAEGQQADPAGDEVVTPAGAHGGLDLSGASGRYDSSAGELRITYRGAITVGTHSSTTYSGVIAQSASSPGGCGIAIRGDATFSGRTFTSSGGGPRRGVGQLDVKDIGPIDGVVLLPSDGSVVFVFSSPLLQNLAYRCSSALHARWIDATPVTTDDEVAPFDLLVLPGTEVGVAGITAAPAAAVATGGLAPTAAKPLPPGTILVSKDLTARVAGARGGLRGLLGRGLTIPVTVSAGCHLRARVIAEGAVVARRSVARLRGGRAVLRLRLDPYARWLLAHRASVPVTIVVTISDAAGSSRSVVRRMLLR